MKIRTAVRTLDFINVIMYTSIGVYIHTAANPLWCGGAFWYINSAMQQTVVLIFAFICK